MVHGCAQVVSSHYTGDEVHDVFVLANLVADGFSPYQEGDLAEEEPTTNTSTGESSQPAFLVRGPAC